jgi:predicted restriction endonuclease
MTEKARRSAAAKKAARTRKRNAKLKKKPSSSKTWPLNPDPWETPMGKRLKSFRKRAFETYGFLCAWCGCGIPAVLEVAHIDGNRSHNGPSNLAILCLTCHRMLDLGIIPKTMVKKMRTKRKLGKWKILIHTGKKK